jgi:hypothetical protein
MVVFSFVTPRFVMILLWIFTDYLSRAYEGWLIPLIGFFILPTTTIAYAIAQNEFTTITGGIKPGGIVVIVLGVLLDVGLIGSWRGRGILRRPDDR